MDPFFILSAGDGQPHQIFIYDVIGDSFWEPGVTAKQIIAQLEQAAGADVVVRINSNGGEHMDGTAIYNALANYSGQVTVRIEGYAQSMATVIACAGDVVECYETALLMIHKASSGAWGFAEDLREAAEALDKANQSLITAYSRKTGKAAEEIEALLDEKRDTWLTAEEARGLGLVDQVVVPAKFNVLQDKTAVTALGQGEGAAVVAPERVPKAVRSELAGVPGVMAYAVEPDRIRALKARAGSSAEADGSGGADEDLPPVPEVEPGSDSESEPQEPEVDPVEQAVAEESKRVSVIMQMARANGVAVDGDFVQGLIADRVSQASAGRQIAAVAKAIGDSVPTQPAGAHSQPVDRGQDGWAQAYRKQAKRS